MKPVTLLLLAFVLVYTASTKNDDRSRLKEIIDNVRMLLEKSTKFLNEMVPNEFDKIRCSKNGPQDFCIAEEILSGINYTQYGITNTEWRIVRILQQYRTNHSANCTVKQDEDEQQLSDLLKNLGCCAQSKYRHHKRSRRSADNIYEKFCESKN
ncbi:hypothetical protein DPEC_G00021850 [Dallia pectoralis]|uniref:Uncharacterized protein n=1 Tax=Dallia pectoralis TaxID=75939 RepID=A0ACC2HGB2_DALPE|nr:hypothetical protein DPEC_G00021850 [Dallia pectoralis]